MCLPHHPVAGKRVKQTPKSELITHNPCHPLLGMTGIMNLPTQLVHVPREMGYIHLKLRTPLSDRGSTLNMLLTITQLKITILSMLRIHLTDGHNTIVRGTPQNPIWPMNNRS